MVPGRLSGSPRPSLVVAEQLVRIAEPQPSFLASCLTVCPTGEHASSRGEEKKTQRLRLRHEAAFGGGASEGDPQK